MIDNWSWFKTRADAELGPTPAGIRFALDDLVRPDRPIGRRRLAEVGTAAGAVRSSLGWPPVRLVHQLIHRVKRVHAAEVRLRGPNGEVVEVIAYCDKGGYDRKVYRLHRHGVFVGEYRTPEALAKVVDLATLLEEDDAERDPPG